MSEPEELEAAVQELKRLVEDLRKELRGNRRAIARIRESAIETKKVAVGAIVLASILFVTGGKVEEFGEEDLGRLIQILGFASGIGFMASSGNPKNNSDESE